MKIENILLGGLKVDHIRPAHRKYPYPVLFIHGMWGGSWVFHFLMTFLVRLGYECYALNLRGHHGSKPGTNLGKATIGDYEKDVVAVIDAIGHPVALIGWSMGSLIGARVAGKNLKVKAYLGIASAPPRGVLLGWKVMVRMPRYLFRMIFGLPVKLASPHCRFLMFNTSTDSEFAEAETKLVHESGWAALLISLWLYGIDQIPCPSALISFDDDNIVGGQDEIARKMGAHHHWRLPGSHTAFVAERHGKEVGERIHAFLQQCYDDEVFSRLFKKIE